MFYRFNWGLNWKKNQVLRPNSDQFTKIGRLGTQLKLEKAKLVQSGV